MQCVVVMACRMLRPGLWILIALFCSACLTSRNSKAISEYRSAINEFDRALGGDTNYRITKGRLSRENGKALMQFEGVLIGEGRYLNIESTPEGIRFYESATAIAGKAVTLIRQNACCMDDKAFREILFLKPGQAISAADILQKHYHFSVATQEYPAALLVMDFTNIYTFTAMHAYWEKDAQVSYFAQAPGTDYNEVMKDIAWQKRSRLELAGLYAWYGVTVAVDIVTATFQLAGLLLLGKGFVR